MSKAAREALDLKFYTHIAETRKERTQYYAAKCKAISTPEDYLSLILDSMDQRKTCIPFYLYPISLVLRTKSEEIHFAGLR